LRQEHVLFGNTSIGRCIVIEGHLNNCVKYRSVCIIYKLQTNANLEIKHSIVSNHPSYRRKITHS